MGVEVTKNPHNGGLSLTVSGDFGFETARELLLIGKARWQEGARQISVNLSGVTGLSSSGVGTLVLLAELAGDDRFQIILDHCAEDVRQLFSSGILDSYFKQCVSDAGSAS